MVRRPCWWPRCRFGTVGKGMSDKSPVEVGGLVLPDALVHAMHEGGWTRSKNVETLRRVFGDEPDGPMFYDLPTMLRQNVTFQASSPDEVYGEVSESSVGVLPPKAVLVGDLGADMPIALDYRDSPGRPRVIYLGPSGWVEVAPSIEALLTELGE